MGLPGTLGLAKRSFPSAVKETSFPSPEVSVSEFLQMEANMKSIDAARRSRNDHESE